MKPDQAYKQKFDKFLEVTAVVVQVDEIKSFLVEHKDLLLNIKHMKIVVPHSENSKLVLLDPSAVLPQKLDSYEKISQNIQLTYSNFSYSQVLREMIPDDLTLPTGFETVGHIAHFNLSDELYPYRNTIGQVLIDKTPNIKTVVTKIGKIENVYRTFNMEVIAGEDNLITTVVSDKQKEGCCNFTFDFSSVYWNSKLANERDRVLSQLNPEDVVCDMFAGVGPFAIRAAKLGCKVLANDLNPSCFSYLQSNAKRNGVSQLVRGFNKDAREFIKEILSGTLEPESGFFPFSHVYMNLPMDAVEFLDVFRGNFNKNQWNKLPVVHVYGFAFEETELIARIEQALGEFDKSILSIHKFRDVSPKKYMFCIEFTLPEKLAFEDSGEDLKKKQKIDSE